MEENELDELVRLLSSARVGERLRAMDRISAKTGRGISRKIDDRRVVSLLIEGLRDGDRRVQRAAARGLRPWVADDPELLDTVLESYATHEFDGGYSHAGLYDTRSGAMWIPRFAALKGHAALLRDGNTDRFFKFEFFIPGQTPEWAGGSQESGQLVLQLIPEWSYSRQQIIPAFDERRLKANAREQEGYGSRVIEAYARMSLPYEVRVHRTEGGGGHHRRRELDVAQIAAHGR